jgi:hypothetical protein
MTLPETIASRAKQFRPSTIPEFLTALPEAAIPHP